MLLIRPVAAGDLDDLLALAAAAGPGMTNLPADREFLERKIAASEASFACSVERPGEETYCFVAEDLDHRRVVGTCAIIATVGLTRPFWSYLIVRLAHTSQELDRYETVDVLQLVNEYRGASEVASLFLAPAYRRDHNGRFLSRSRFLFMGQFATRFADTVMAEMRGVHEPDGRTPFWEGLGRHFFDMEFRSADRLSSLGKYQFIADLMPKYPIYIRLLPRDAQAVIGQPHPDTRPAYELLLREGFRFEGCVDIFDAGPTIHGPRDQLRAVRDSRVCELARVLDTPPEGPRHMLGTTELARYRACAAPLARLPDGRIAIDAATAAALAVDAGDHLRVVEL